MSAETFLVRSGRTTVLTADERLVTLDGLDIYATVRRRGFLHWDWDVWTTGAVDRQWDWGTTLTRAGARVEAKAAAHRPGLLGGAS